MKQKLNKYVIFIITAFFIGSLFPLAYSAVDNGLDQLKILVDVMTKIQENYVEEKAPKDLITNALYGMVNNLDEFSEFIDVEHTKRIQEDTKGEFAGVGIRLVGTAGKLVVYTPLPNTPAYDAGIEPEDNIIQINDKLVKDMTSDEAIELLRGKVGEKVKVIVERKGENGKTINKTFTLKKEKIIPQIVYYEMLKDNIGYINITDFSGHTMSELKKAMKELEDKKMEALILDLRFNPGGTLNSAVDLAGAFLGDKKLVVYTKGRKDEFFKEYFAPVEGAYTKIPLILLVNEASASASEIVSGALQDHGRALLIGTRTFGKGSVQQVMTLQGGNAMKITVAKYYTPKGRMIHRNFKDKSADAVWGIEPDIKVDFDLPTSKKALNYRTMLIYSPSKKTAVKDGDEVKDIVLERAQELLKARKVLGTLDVEKQESITKETK